MDSVVRQLMMEFSLRRELGKLAEPQQFEVFVAHCVLSQHTYSDFKAEDFCTGGSHDGGIDGYAIVLNNQLYRHPEDLERQLATMTDASPTVVITQAKTSAKMERSVVADLRVRTEAILRTEEILLNASNIEPLRECLRVMQDKSECLSDEGARLAVVYANTSQAANAEILHEAERAAEALSGTGIIGEAVFQCLGRDELRRLSDQAQWSAKAKLTFSTQYEAPAASGVTKAFNGMVPAQALVTALSDDDNVLDHRLFAENIREFQPEETVNDEIRETLKDPQRRLRFGILNKGVTIVARRLQVRPGTPAVMWDFQVVDGCQTCHVLSESWNRLGDVSVKVQLLECEDDDIIDEIVTATNRQTVIPKVYFRNRDNLIRRLEIYYRHQEGTGRTLRFARRPSPGTGGLRNGVVGMSEQLRAYIAMFGPKPPSNGHRDLDNKFRTLFKHATVEEFYAAAAALYRWDWLVHNRRVAKRYRPLGYQAVAVLGVVYGVRPLNGSDKAKRRRLEQLEKVTWSDGGWDQMAIEIQQVLDDALITYGSDEPKTAAASLKFGETVLTHAKQLPLR
ncbi:MAG TPA: AIPR family protein [Candidatus Stackebrandtia faecavium]|nr:AIPR family protein [Candidatus Stackebrandtia faecavium]